MHERTAMAHRRSSGEVRPYVRSSKPRFNWTGDLKQLFEDAMTVLGGTRKATPKQIRELLKCPHIQLSHIKSRLQMCRIRMEEKERRSVWMGCCGSTYPHSDCCYLRENIMSDIVCPDDDVDHTAL
ncbi:putative Myb family transcription factor At1g14600, partial [Phalaenopsis equestris]|uniref:putative Myb family transcription factor At1g14600 n=1 Tax=Phalaenopsis equestris TaxID=78828 RepID=UPI0009E417F2